MRPTYAVDLDGVMAHYDEWKGFEYIGKPIKSVIRKVKQLHAKGFRVVCFTARASVPEGRHHVEQWLNQHGLPWMHVTSNKTLDFVAIWDDRAWCIEKNTGKVLGRPKTIPKMCTAVKA